MSALVSMTVSWHGEFTNISAKVDADSGDEAREVAEMVLNGFAGGKLTVIRAAPEAISETDFDTKETRHRGYVRFTFSDQPGEWRYSDAVAPCIGFAAS